MSLAKMLSAKNSAQNRMSLAKMLSAESRGGTMARFTFFGLSYSEIDLNHHLPLGDKKVIRIKWLLYNLKLL
jgi:hypothetical protein